MTDPTCPDEPPSEAQRFVYRAADRQAMPWKNGGGVTYEIAREPPAASLDDFDWRISMARVDVPGPFSEFAGVRRTFAVLEGAIELSVEGAEPRRLDAASTPLTFDGELRVTARPLAPTLDLNVMVRRARCVAHVQIVAADIASLGANAATVASVVFAIRGRVRVLHGRQTLVLERHDACRLEAASCGDARLAIDAGGAAAIIRLDRVAD